MLIADLAEEPAVLLGEIIDQKYKVLSIVGTGGMGVVYRAQHCALNRIVALKVLSTGFDNSEAERFERESLALSRLQHRNVVRFYGYGFHNGLAYLAMEHVEGSTLQSHLQKFGKLSVDDSLHIALQICRGLAEVHSKGLVHRDLKPSNIMLMPEPIGGFSTKIIDFGLVKPVVDSIKKQQLTEAGFIVGTAMYMSPEQCLGQTVDHRTDLYAVGCILYECLHGKPPFANEHIEVLMKQQVLDRVPPVYVTGCDDDLVAVLESIIHKALSKELKSRYESATKMGDDLLAAQNRHLSRISQPAHSLDAENTKKWWYHKRFVMALTIILCLAVTAIISTQRTVPEQSISTQQTSVDLFAQIRRSVETRSCEQLDFKALSSQLIECLSKNDKDHLLDAQSQATALEYLAEARIKQANTASALHDLKTAVALYQTKHIRFLPHTYHVVLDLISNYGNHAPACIHFTKQFLDQDVPALDRESSYDYVLSALVDALVSDGRPAEGVDWSQRARGRYRLLNAEMRATFACGKLAQAKALADEYLQTHRAAPENTKYTKTPEFILTRILLASDREKFALDMVTQSPDWKEQDPGMAMLVAANRNNWMEADSQCDKLLVESNASKVFAQFIDVDLKHYSSILESHGRIKRSRIVQEKLQNLEQAYHRIYDQTT